MRKFFGVIILSFFIFSGWAQSSALVLSGGGAKGAYQVGIWEAMYDFGISEDISVFSGTSVGALNGALFASTTPERAARIWLNKVDFDTFLSPDSSLKNSVIGNALSDAKENQPKDSETYVENFLANTFYNLADAFDEVLDEIGQGVKDFFSSEHTNGYFDRTELKKIIDREISVSQLNKNKKIVYAAAVRKRKLITKFFSTILELDNCHYFKLNDQLSDKNAGDILLASSALPGVYESQTLAADVIENNKKAGVEYEYIDGGVEQAGGRNTPVMPVLQHPEIKKVYIVFLESYDENNANFYEDELEAMVRSGKKFVFIYPSKSLGKMVDGTVNFSPEKIKDLIALGYSDGANLFSKNGYFKVPPAFRK